MIRQVPVPEQIFALLFPPFEDEVPPTSWQHYVKEYLERETKAERYRFYGPDDARNTLEGKYPGYDYTFPPHRRRLEQWPHHKALFEAMDQLRLSPLEIKQLCCWQGTLAAKHQFEEKNNTKVEDTTGKSVYQRMLCQQRSPLHQRCPECRPRPLLHLRGGQATPYIESHTLHKQPTLPTYQFSSPAPPQSIYAPGTATPRPTWTSEGRNQAELHSVGIALNQRLMAAAVAREQGDDSVSMDPDFEEWFKAQHENGDMLDIDMDFAPFLDLSATLPEQISGDITT
ncbi:hypothetical protein FH972_026556 [Carpinus fangiana]|uniref:Uncharacterized protein n=1 Tax=Carpinus fangiana TaxID=176857 RepID=A0A5N6L4C0_9ROSI|nr:hypothetical protein FH972_026556 [Carpinus fangiana]